MARRLAAALACAAVAAVPARAAAPAPRAVAPPTAGVFGKYRFTYALANDRGTTTWVLRVLRRCDAPCRRFTVRARLLGEPRERRAASVFRWRGGEYTRIRVLRGDASCRARDGSAVARGYDVVSTEDLRVRRAEKGRVVRMSGNARDDYRVNARGRRAGCRPGAFIFRVSGVALGLKR